MMKRGEKFIEPFDFKDAEGRSRSINGLDFELIARHDFFIKRYTLKDGLVARSSTVYWVLSPEQTEEYTFDNVFYVLNLVTGNDRVEIMRGVVEIA